MIDRIYTFIVAVTIALFTLPGIAVSADKADLADRVQDAISHHFFYGITDTEFDIDVSANDDGAVTLDGRANTLFDKYRLHEVVSKVPGVTKISNQVAVDTKVIADDVIKRNIMRSMNYNNSLIEKDNINVAVDNGLVMLDGTVSYFYEKKLMTGIASWQEGVRGLRNDIKVLRPEKALSDKNLERVLHDILSNQFGMDKGDVTISVNDGVARVNGMVDNLWSKNNIEEEFLDVIGITGVDNNLKIES